MNDRSSLQATQRGNAVLVTRGLGIEAIHRASVAVVDAMGRLTFKFGDPELRTLTRSAIKPFQALPIVLTGAAETFELGPQELAIAAASHNGSDQHAAVVKAFLTKIDLSPTDLLCGTQWPLGMRLTDTPALKGESQDPLRHNCSGKHAGFLAVARRLGVPADTYLLGDGAVQQQVVRALAAVSGVPPAEMPRGTDGCSAPNYGLSLSVLARATRRLMSLDVGSPALAEALSRVRDAMLTHPLLVSGRGRFDYDLMRAFAGNAICKGGAEGIVAIAFRDPPLAFVVKVHDGASRAVPPIACAVLEQLGILGNDVPEPLARYRRPQVQNQRGIVTGELIPVLKLESATR